MLACEGTDKLVSINGNEDIYVSCKLIEAENAGVTVRLDNGLCLLDSMSVGKEWNDDSAFTIWLKNSK